MQCYQRIYNLHIYQIGTLAQLSSQSIGFTWTVQFTQHTKNTYTHISRSTCINYGNYLNFFSLLLRSLITNHQRYVLKFVRCLRVWNCKIDAHAIEKFMNYLEKSKSWLASNALRSNERKKKNNTQARVLTRVGFAKKNIFGDCDTVIWGTNKQSHLIWFRSTFFLVRNFFRSDFVWYFFGRVLLTKRVETWNRVLCYVVYASTMFSLCTQVKTKVLMWNVRVRIPNTRQNLCL